jgi:purine-nucleoside phosphorylase
MLRRFKEPLSERKKPPRFIQSQTALRPRIALLLSNAFDTIADRLTEMTTVRYETIPHFARTNSSSPAGRLVIGKLADVPLAVLCGRVHYYEGQGLEAVVFPIQMLARMGMIGSVDERLGSRFADMSEVYSKRYREIARSSADNLGFDLLEGVFAGHTGPSYETPAEVRSLRNQGVDVVGMSVVPEVIAARHLGIRVLAICATTNIAAGAETKTIPHSEVLLVAQELPKRLPRSWSASSR